MEREWVERTVTVDFLWLGREKLTESSCHCTDPQAKARRKIEWKKTFIETEIA
jgi:hypothetical protein